MLTKYTMLAQIVIAIDDGYDPNDVADLVARCANGGITLTAPKEVAIDKFHIDRIYCDGYAINPQTGSEF